MENFHIGAGSLTIGGTDVGETTEDGVVVTYEPNIHLHHSGKFGTTPVKASLIGMNLTVQVTLGETTLANMQKVFAGVITETGQVKFGGVAGREITGAELVLTPFDGTDPWTFLNAVPTSSVEVAYQVENERVYQVTFTALVDEEADDDENLATVGTATP